MFLYKEFSSDASVPFSELHPVCSRRFPFIAKRYILFIQNRFTSCTHIDPPLAPYLFFYIRVWKYKMRLLLFPHKLTTCKSNKIPWNFQFELKCLHVSLERESVVVGVLKGSWWREQIVFAMCHVFHFIIYLSHCVNCEHVIENSKVTFQQ
jgi:hypothetical protein